MSDPTVMQLLGRRLRLAVVGGGPGSFIGAMHRQAARLDDHYQLVAAALSSRPDAALQAGQSIGLPPERCYADGAALITAEAQRADGAEVLAIMTPNDSHASLALLALQHGMDVICDKPLSNTLAEAQAVHEAVQRHGRILCLTHNYSGFPLVRQAKAMVMQGDLGDIRLVQVEYVQGGRAVAGPSRRPWKDDPVRSGPSLVLGDIGTHAHQLLRFITGLEVSAVAADVGTIVPSRPTHDFAGALLQLSNGARGCLWVTQAAAGMENGLRIRISGALGTLEWALEQPTVLHFKPLGAPAQIRTPNGPGTLPLAARSSRIVAGHPEGFHEAFANLYTDVGLTIAAVRSGRTTDTLWQYFPNSWDGLQGLRFIEAVLASSRDMGRWTHLPT
ncbi:Gfo/Idh/MocA family oxidoreductase [Curvibacter sp. CHRR-16]|uniref:Gfo/Idh/MocA family protein n=1 Tax=Curvibacter sp. CHRR-16 TaxID=2835872 RepID=UPI001BDAF440|nr:Gfo/Idh/MocA family oxidoreductase [Curvibacter sp. CHRR-16]MBT0570284.1 Gfo/Idh/MocA family oxidoreductase [Curvibacter sp. CHRR-16]